MQDARLIVRKVLRCVDSLPIELTEQSEYSLKSGVIVGF